MRHTPIAAATLGSNESSKFGVSMYHFPKYIYIYINYTEIILIFH